MYNQIDYMSLDRNGGKLKQYHHVNLSSEFVNDCKMWVSFLTCQNYRVNRPILDWFEDDKDAEDLEFYTDASKHEKLGFGCFFNGNWVACGWEPGFIKSKDPSIAYLELYALCIGVAIWANKLSNRKVIIYCDNKSTRDIVNKGTTGCKNMMMLMRNLVLSNLKHNTKIFVRYISSEDNFLADRLSRLKYDEFWRLAPKYTQRFPESLPQDLWPVSKIWIN